MFLNIYSKSVFQRLLIGLYSDIQNGDLLVIEMNNECGFSYEKVTKETFACSKLIAKTLEKGVKYFQS